MNHRAFVSDILGLAAVGCAAGLVSAALFWSKTIDCPWILWLVGFPVLAGTSLFTWHVSQSARIMDREKWGAMVIFTPMFGAISFAIDVFVGSSNGSYKNFIEAAAHAGSPFGFPLTVLICPILTIISLGSWIRCMVNPPTEQNEIEA